MADICDFAKELAKEGSDFRRRWKEDESKASRLKVAKRFGLSGDDLAMVDQVLTTGDSTPIKDACGKEVEGRWVK
jgi:hypothetical protein